MSRRAVVFMHYVEVKALPGSGMEDEGHIGGFVYTFVKAGTAKSAEAKVRSALQEDLYEVLELEKPLVYSDLEWEDPEAAKEYDQCAKEALETGDVVYGTFDAYRRR